MFSWMKKLSIMGKAATARKNPRFASLFVTRRCDLHCEYCRSRDQGFPDIDLEAWEGIVNRLHGWGVRHFSITGGEPMLRKGISLLVEHIAKRKKSVCWLISNFRPMTASALDDLAEAGLDFLTCSMDSLQGPGEKSGRTCLSLLEYARARGIVPACLAVVTKRNINDIPELLADTTRRGMLFDMGLYQHVGGLFSPGDDGLKVKDRAALEDLRTLVRKAKRESGLVAPSFGYLNADLAMYEKMSWKCSADRDSFLVVNNDGRLMACQEHLTDVDVRSIASLSDPAWRKAKREKVEACRGCFYGCYYQKENVRLADALYGLYTLLMI